MPTGDDVSITSLEIGDYLPWKQRMRDICLFQDGHSRQTLAVERSHDCHMTIVVLTITSGGWSMYGYIMACCCCCCCCCCCRELCFVAPPVNIHTHTHTHTHTPSQEVKGQHTPADLVAQSTAGVGFHGDVTTEQLVSCWWEWPLTNKWVWFVMRAAPKLRPLLSQWHCW